MILPSARFSNLPVAGLRFAMFAALQKVPHTVSALNASSAVARTPSRGSAAGRLWHRGCCTHCTTPKIADMLIPFFAAQFSM